MRQGFENLLTVYDKREPDDVTIICPVFRIYDVDDSGSINITEMTSIISTMDELEGEENMQGKDSPAAR